MPDVVGPKVCGIVCALEILWDPGEVGARQLAVCDDCFWLMTLFTLSIQKQDIYYTYHFYGS